MTRWNAGCARLLPLVFMAAGLTAQPNAALAQATGARPGAAPASPRPAGEVTIIGSHLVKGMQLRYKTNDETGAPWVVESANLSIDIHGMRGCSTFSIRMQENRPPNVATFCQSGNMQMGWDSVGNAWRPVRPTAPNDSLVMKRGDGGIVRYTTRGFIDHTIGGRKFKVLPTEVLTLDAKGLPVRRLRELYSTELGTAVRGTFQAPDVLAAGGWKTEIGFDLVEIVAPK